MLPLMMKTWKQRWQQAKGRGPVELDLGPYRFDAASIDHIGEHLDRAPEERLRNTASKLRGQARAGTPLDDLLPETFALTREIAHRVLGMRPFDVQVVAGIALHQGKLAEMRTGEGKTLAAVMPPRSMPLLVAASTSSRSTITSLDGTGRGRGPSTRRWT